MSLIMVKVKFTPVLNYTQRYEDVEGCGGMIPHVLILGVNRSE